MNAYASQKWVRAAVLLVVLFGLALSPGGSNAAAPSNSSPGVAPLADNLSVFILSPLVKIYEGDTITLPYIVEDNSPGGMALAPLTPGIHAATASLGQVAADPNGMGGSLTYTAGQAGQETIVLNVSNALGSGSDSLNLTIYPRPNYYVDFMLVSEDSDEAGGAFRAIFSGDGSFAATEGQPVSGEGQAHYNFVLWVTNEAFACNLTPPIQGSTGFTVSGEMGGALASLVPGSLDPLTIDLNFPAEISLNGSNIVCAGLGGITANFPWPASSGPASGYPLTGLFFPGEGGMVEVTAPKTWGVVYVTRIEP